MIRRERIRDAVAERRDALISLCQDLVRLPSLANHEAPCQERVAEELQRIGFQVRRQPVRFDQLMHHPAFSDDGFSPTDRYNVLGTLPGTGHGRSLILNGHVDVVAPGEEGQWRDGPWSGTVRDGRLWGRGSCDMKSGLAAGIMAVGALRDLGWAPGGDLIIESVVGEESGGVGTLATIVDGVRADGAIVLEPTGLDLCPMQSGALTFRILVPGQAAHGALRQHGVSALTKYGRIHEALLRLEHTRHAGRLLPLFEEPRYAAPLSVGTIRGGEWHSTVPESVVVEGRYGIFPGEAPGPAREAFEAAIADVLRRDPWLRAHPPRVTWFEGQFESGATPPDHPLVTALGEAHHAVRGAAARCRAVPYGSDLRLFTNHANMPAVLYGPGDVRLAHAVNEHIRIADVLEATEILAVMLSRWCGSR